MTTPIAIVGMACRYPEANTPAQLWENVLAQRRAFRPIPAERLSLADYAPREGGPDTTYVRYAALLEGYAFDRVGHRIAADSFHAADLCHWLALDVAQDALRDAGFGDDDIPHRQSTGVLVGNSLAGEFTRAGQMRLRWPYVRRQLEAVLAREGWTPDRRSALLESLEVGYKHPFPVPNEESLAGGLSNTIAGRICNHFGLHGGGYTLDGACASSLLAVGQACSALSAGDLDLALAGGVDLSLDPFELVGFARTGALATDRMRIYDSHPTGFLPGEGCGFVVLMRHADAVAHGCRVHAVIRGWGMSSDGKGGLTRPEASGQQLAMARAYARAGVDVTHVAYFEGHGTGTAVGDVVELQAIGASIRETRGNAVAIGSIKALIGHTKAASGVAGLIKASMALKAGILPPTAGCEQPHALLDGRRLRALDRAESWPDAPLLAGINSMGFGGINVHVVLDRDSPPAHRPMSARLRQLDATAQDSELFVVDADDAVDASFRLRELAALVKRLSQGELPDLAASLATASSARPLRIAVVASLPHELAEHLEAAARRLETSAPIGRFEHDDNVYIGKGTTPPRIGFLFPGQGSPTRADGGGWRRRFGDVEEIYRGVGLPAGNEVETTVAQPALVTASMAALGVLTRLGIEAKIAVGHSLGEISALAWSGAFPPDAAIRIARGRGHAMGQLERAGAMASVGLPVDDVLRWIAGTELEIAAVNAPRQIVLSGSKEELEALLVRLQAERVPVFRLPVSHAFHSRFVAAAETPLRLLLHAERIKKPQRLIVSTVTGERIPVDTDLTNLLCRQLTAPVRFLDAVREASADLDIWIEVGAGTTLARLASLGSHVPAFFVDACGAGLGGLLRTAAAAFAAGARPNLEELFADRAIRPFDSRPRQFLANPCESAPVGTPVTVRKHEPTPPTGEEATAITAITAEPAIIADHLRGLLATRADLPATAISLDNRLLSDLHLNSISASQAIVETARALGLPVPPSPLDFADARITEIAEVLATGAGEREPVSAVPEGLGHWLRGFRVIWREQSRMPLPRPVKASSSWKILARPGLLARALEALLISEATGNGIALLLEKDDADGTNDELLVAAARLLSEDRDCTFLLVQGEPGAAGFARSLHLERNGTTVVAEVPLENPQALQWVVAEVRGAHGFIEVRYDTTGRREEPAWELVDLPEADESATAKATSLPQPDEVLLVSGGGYGIAAACAMAIAKQSGCALAILGRSRPGSHDELDRHLADLDANGVRWRYYVADVTQPHAVAAAVDQVRQHQGPVAAVLHAAGVNIPRLGAQIEVATLHDTLAPKVDGLNHLLAAIGNTSAPRLLMTFGSIIARIGLAGQSEYALANERLAHAVEDFAARLPGCRCVNVEWSVWSGTGMGERLGSVDALARQGIAPIASADGVALLQRILAAPASPVSLVVCGRFGRPATIRFVGDQLPFLRFIERVGAHVPGVELVVDAELSVDSDPYLADHVYGGEQLLPAVVGLEAMAQAALTLDGRSGPITGYRFEDVAFARPVVVPASGSTTLRIAALRHPSGRVDVALRSSSTGYQVDHFRASCMLVSEPGEPPSRSRSPVCGEAIALEPAVDVYGPLLPHGAAFQRLRAYTHLSADTCVAEIASDGSASWFRRDLPDVLLLGDPGVRDAAIHALQACVPHRTVLPVAIKRLDVRVRAAGSRQMLAREFVRDGRTLVYDLDLDDVEGGNVERWTGLALRMVDERPTPSQWALPLLGPYLQRRAADLLPGPTVQMGMDRGHRGDAHRLSGAMLDGRAKITRHLDGRPLADGGYGLSHAYADGLMLAVAGQRAVGCDIETVSNRSPAIWRDLLGSERFRLAEQIRIELGEDLDTAATRVWTAMESIKKAGLAAISPMALEPRHNDGWLLLRSGSFAVAGTVFAVRPNQRVLAVAIAAETPA